MRTQLTTDNRVRSTFEVDTTNLNKPTLRLEVMIDGKPGYQCVVSLFGFDVDGILNLNVAELNSSDHLSTFLLRQHWALLYRVE